MIRPSRSLMAMPMGAFSKAERKRSCASRSSVMSCRLPTMPRTSGSSRRLVMVASKWRQRPSAPWPRSTVLSTPAGSTKRGGNSRAIRARSSGCTKLPIGLVPVAVRRVPENTVEGRAHVVQDPGPVGHDDDVGGVGDEGLEAPFRLAQLELDRLPSGRGPPEELDHQQGADQPEDGHPLDERLADQGGGSHRRRWPTGPSAITTVVQTRLGQRACEPKCWRAAAAPKMKPTARMGPQPVL